MPIHASCAQIYETGERISSLGNIDGAVGPLITAAKTLEQSAYDFANFCRELERTVDYHRTMAEEGAKQNDRVLDDLSDTRDQIQSAIGSAQSEAERDFYRKQLEKVRGNMDVVWNAKQKLESLARDLSTKHQNLIDSASAADTIKDNASKIGDNISRIASSLSMEASELGRTCDRAYHTLSRLSRNLSDLGNSSYGDGTVIDISSANAFFDSANRISSSVSQMDSFTREMVGATGDYSRVIQDNVSSRMRERLNNISGIINNISNEFDRYASRLRESGSLVREYESLG